MKSVFRLALAGLAIGLVAAAPVAADPGKGNGHGKKHSRQYDHDGPRGGHYGRAYYRADCPPGLAKKNPPCIPPGHAKGYGERVGDILRVGDYTIIRDPGRYDLEPRRGWNYYRDDDRIYRVDSGTRKVLSVLNLIDAFSN